MFKKMLSAFVEVTDETPQESAPQTVASESTQRSAPPPLPKVASTPASAPVSTVAPSAGVNEEMQKDLMQAITHANLDGYDYLELMEAVKNMASLPFTEEQKIMAAFATVANLTTRDKLITSVDHYIKVIDESENKFLASAQRNEQSQVKGREDEIVALDKEVVTLQQQMVQITQRIGEIQKRKENLVVEKEKQKEKIYSAIQSFKTTAQKVREQLLADKQRIGTILK